MPTQPTTRSHKSRHPKPGTGFLLVRLAAWFLKITGGLLISAATIGGIVTLVKIGPTLAGAFQFPEQKMAGFIITILLGVLLVFVLLGAGGAILMGLGFAFSYWGTEPVAAGTEAGTT